MAAPDSSSAAYAFRRYGICIAALLGVVALHRWVVPVNTTTAALFMLLVVLSAATRWGLAESIFTSIAGVLSFNFFFLPPIGTFTIADPQNWAALSAFLITAIIASKLSASAKQRAQEALAGKNEIARLYELSRALLMAEGRDAVSQSVVEAARILQIEHIAFYDAAAGRIHGAVGESPFSAEQLAKVAETGEPLTRSDAAVIPVSMGARRVGSLATVGRLSSAVRESVASLLAINYERAAAINRAAAAEIARRNEEFKSSLLDGLAHDLKTPLTAIRTCITRLISIPPRTEEVRQELLNIIDQESVRLGDSIGEAIELARIESRELHLEPELIEAGEIIQAALAQARDEDRQRYSIHGPVSLLVHADRSLLRRALSQIIENARKYTAPGSPIRIEARGRNGQVDIAVLDRGPGINPDEVERIFEKFYRGRDPRGKVEGTGMGLAIAKGIVEAHGGTIKAENRPGGGAEILLTLPAAGRES